MDNTFYTESFQDFATKVGPMDLALYAGAGLIVWVLFQDQLSGLKDIVSNLLGKATKTNATPQPSLFKSNKDDKFFALISSWKKTRDLAVEVGCSEAVKVADQMFPHLSPLSCQEKQA